MAAAIAAADSNIENVEYVERDDSAATLLFAIEVKNRKHLADVIRRVRRTGVVSGAYRYPAVKPRCWRRRTASARRSRFTLAVFRIREERRMSTQHHCHRAGAGRDRPLFAGRPCRQHGVFFRPDSAGSGDWRAGRWRYHGADAPRVRQSRLRWPAPQAVRWRRSCGWASMSPIWRNFAAVNAVMAEYFQQPYPARSTIEVSGLPKARPGRSGCRDGAGLIGMLVSGLRRQALSAPGLRQLACLG